MKLTKYEKETILNFNEEENTMSIYTHNASLKRHLVEFSKKHQVCAKLKHSGSEGSMTYVVDKNRVSIRLLPIYSEERRKATSEHGKKNGFSSIKE